MKTAGGIKIGAKLGCGFGALLALMLAMGMFAAYEMGKVNEMSTEMADNWMPSIHFVEALNTDTAVYRLKELQHIISDNDADRSKYEQAMAHEMAELVKDRDAYVKLISSSEEKSMFHDYTTHFNSYMAMHEKVLQLSRAGKTVEAITLMRGESQKAFNEMADLLGKLVELNVDGGNDASKRGDAIFASAKIMIAAIVIIGLVLGALIAWLVTRGITGPLTEALQAANRMSEGDFTVRLESDSRDEVGQLVQAM